jgi:hypothetical protein
MPLAFEHIDDFDDVTGGDATISHANTCPELA